MDPDPDPGHFFKIHRIFLTRQNFKIFDEPFRNKEYVLQFLVDILPLGSGSVDSTDPYPKHCL